MTIVNNLLATGHSFPALRHLLLTTMANTTLLLKGLV
ncbi:hypothetical protein Patl1_14578 [Pistacia atlantica]|uniref:Uncharacterized protein n=1 Tax=Pistacia atlantica TaxID=434234 RepID=A0ACC1AYJ8_9ROSI|nr:hypothetical protein Patl1_14578 [Pistacia atlantica]